MTELSKEILKNRQTRKTKEQKDEFIRFMRENLPDIQVEEGGFGKNKNMILGDIDSAEVVFSAHYDTCARLPFPNFLTPKNIPLYILYNLVVVAVMIAAVFVVSFVTAKLFQNIWITELAVFAVYFLIMFIFFGGKPNEHTANDNTSGVISLCEIYGSLTEEQRKRTAFIFFDNEENMLLGSRFFLKRHKAQMKDKLLINLDCVSDGDDILMILNKTAEKKYRPALEAAFTEAEGKRVRFEKSSSTIYPSDQAGFPNYAAIAAFEQRKVIGLYLGRIHTSKDTVFDEKNIELIREGAVRFIESI